MNKELSKLLDAIKEEVETTVKYNQFEVSTIFDEQGMLLSIFDTTENDIMITNIEDDEIEEIENIADLERIIDKSIAFGNWDNYEFIED